MDYYSIFFKFKYDFDTDTVHLYCKHLTDRANIAVQEEYMNSLIWLGNLWMFYQYLYNLINQFEITINKYKYYLNISYYTAMSFGFFLFFNFHRSVLSLRNNLISTMKNYG